MRPAGFEPAIPASKRPQTHALDGAATGIGTKGSYKTKRNQKQLRSKEQHNLYTSST
jgi:hypothetical protein